MNWLRSMGLVEEAGFETQSELLQRTILDREDERVTIPDESLNPKYLEQSNAALAWI